MRVHHALGLACCSRGIAQPHGRVFVYLRPFITSRLTFDEILVVDLVFEAALAAFAMATDDQKFDTGHFVPDWLEQRQNVFVCENHSVVGMVNNVFEIGWREADIECMKHCTHRRHTLIKLEVAIVVPHKARNSVAYFDSMIL